MPLPEALKNAPSLFSGNEFYFNAFKQLSTCRVNGMGMGNITYFMCVDYCNENQIYEDQRQDFIVVIQAMDETFIDYCDKKSKKKSKPKAGDKDGNSAGIRQLDD